MICPNCQASEATPGKFCLECGVKIEPPKPTPKRVRPPTKANVALEEEISNLRSLVESSISRIIVLEDDIHSLETHIVVIEKKNAELEVILLSSVEKSKNLQTELSQINREIQLALYGEKVVEPPKPKPSILDRLDRWTGFNKSQQE